MNWRHAIRFFEAGRMGVIAGVLGLVSLPHGMAAPANDNLSAAQTLGPTLPVTAAGNNSGATLETDEWSFGGSSVWYSWTAPSSGWVVVDTLAATGTAQLDTVLAVYTGLTQATLELVGVNDEAWGDPSHASKLAFYAVAGTTYRIAVFGYDGGPSVAEGAFSLHLTSAAPEAIVTGISVSPATVDVTNAAQTVDVTVTISSVADLFTVADPSFLLRSPDGWSSLPSVPIAATDLISGNSLTGTYKKTLTIPLGIQAGNWIPAVTIYGNSGTNVWSPDGNGAFYDHWVINGSTQLLTVQNTGTLDSEAPVLTAFSVNPTSAAPFDQVKVTLSVTDAGGSGFHRADIWLANGGPWIAGATSAERVSGDASSGQYEVTFDVPSDLAPGTYHFEIWVEDAAGNTNGYDGTVSGNILSGNPLTVKTLTIEGWRRKFFGFSGNTGNAANSADPDNDGTMNLLEFATNHDPTTADSGVTSVTSAGGLLTLSYTRALAAVAAGVQFFAEWSDSPGGPWSTAGVTEAITSSDASTEQVQASVSLGSGPRRFVRLRVFLPTP